MTITCMYCQTNSIQSVAEHTRVKGQGWPPWLQQGFEVIKAAAEGIDLVQYLNDGTEAGYKFSSRPPLLLTATSQGH